MDHHHHYRRGSFAKLAAFCLRLTSRVATRHAAHSNLVFSPLSLHALLSLLAAGSTGETRDQLVSFLLPGNSSGAGSTELLQSLSSEVVKCVLADGAPHGGPQLSFASGVWVDRLLTLKAAFKDVAVSTYKAEARSVDFQNKPAEAAAEVNSWAERATAGRIRELLPADSVDRTTELILTDALYFKGAWMEKFDASLTHERPFHLLDGSSTRAPFMTSRSDQFIRFNKEYSVLKLPYKQGGDHRREFSMYVFLPHRKDGLWDLVEELASESGKNHLDGYLPVHKVKVDDFGIPKLNISFGFEASEIMKEMGLVRPFTGGELTEMVEEDSLVVGKRPLAVTSVFHKAFVEVNEEGTEAAAASAAVVTSRSLSPRVHFVADHPFIFLIREDLTGVILFVGHVLNPTNS